MEHFEEFKQFKKEKAIMPTVRKFKGPGITKGFRIAPDINESLEKFCYESGYSQQDVINTAILQLLKTYREK